MQRERIISHEEYDTRNIIVFSKFFFFFPSSKFLKISFFSNLRIMCNSGDVNQVGEWEELPALKNFLFSSFALFVFFCRYTLLAILLGSN